MKTRTDDQILQSCRAHLSALQPVKNVAVKYSRVNRGRPEIGAQLVLETQMGRLHYFYEIKRALSQPRIEHLLLQLQRDSGEAKARPLLLTDYLPPRLAQRLIEAGVNFVDEAGNVYIDWPGKLHIRILGARLRRPRETKAGRLSQSSGLQVIFVLLAEPRGASMPYRDLAKASGVALGSVARVMQELKEKRYLAQKARNQWSLSRKRELLEFWIGGYGERLRPKLVIGRFQPSEEDLARTLARLKSEMELRQIAWALTGGYAADLLTRHFRGNQLTCFVEEWSTDLAKNLKWLPAPHGPVMILRHFSPMVVFTLKQPIEAPVAHPLLVYAELVFQGRERELEAARLVYDRYLASLLHGD